MRISMDRPAVRALLWLLLAVPCLSQCALAQALEHDFSAGILYGGLFAPEQWNPVNLGFRNNTDRPVDGTVRMPINGDPGGVEIQVPVYVPARSRVRMAVPVFMPPSSSPTQSSQRIPPVSIISWHDHGGARIARSELVGKGLAPDLSTDASGLPTGGFVLSVVDANVTEGDVEYPSQLTTVYKTRGIVCSEPTMLASAMPADARVLSCCRAISLRATNPDTLTQAQRAALMDYIRGGGLLLLSSPRQSDALDESWLAPYLPMRLVGWRQAKQVAGIPLTGWLNIAEATPAPGAVLLREGDYVHAAYRQLGLGRIVFTSFPLSGLSPKDPRTTSLWQQLLAVERPAVGMEGTRLRRDYGKFLEPMLGRPAASWTAAATTIIVYLALIMALQFWFRGASRPQAFAAALSVAILIALVFVVMTLWKTRSSSLQSARVAVVDMGREGGTAQELIAYAGLDADDFSLAAATEKVSFHPVFNQGDPAAITVPQFVAPRVGVSAERVKRVWESRWPAGKQWGVSATAAFTPEGVSLRLRNDSELKLESAQLVWKRERFMVGDIAREERQLVVGEANRRPPGEFMTATGLASQDQRLKGDILAALLDRTDLTPASAAVDAPVLVSWVSQPPESLNCSPELNQRGEQVLLRTQVLVEPTRKGQKVRIDWPLSRIETREFRGLPYNAAKDEWSASNLPGQWLVGLRAPAQAGTLRPEKVRLNVEFDAPAYTITLRRGQMRGAKVVENSAGTLVKQWVGPIGPQPALEFDCDPADFDSEGRLWLLLEVNLPSRPAGGLMPFWKTVRFAAVIDGEVLAGPADNVIGVVR